MAMEYPLEQFVAELGQEPDRSAFKDPFAEPALQGYFERIGEWLGYIRLLGLPRLQENPDIPIEELFVEPALAAEHLSPDRPESEWAEQTRPAVEALAAHPRLVLLGDPGSGKSTLVSWLAFRLSRPGESNWSERFGRLVPLPLILRELELGSLRDFRSLLAAFRRHPLAEPLSSARALEEVLARGQAYLILDGLDEVGNLEVRRALRDAVWEGMVRYPRCRWLLTSRLVGFDEVPFDCEQLGTFQKSRVGRSIEEDLLHPVFSGQSRFEEPQRVRVAKTLYLAPFSDERIRHFARNWYAQREAARHLRSEGARNLIDSVFANTSTHRLARVPNLLAMMALIHRVRARLPYGRALLYEEIAQAYLETIPDFRRLDSSGFTLAQKRAWLGWVAFRMQQRRAEAAAREEKVSGDILVDEDEVRTWITEAMGQTGRRDEEAARVFLDFVARRSGLLIPRAPAADGGHRFAFTHLSFQEYFAAVHLAEILQSPLWLSGEGEEPGASRADLRAYGNQAVWRETLVLLFELLADKRGWPRTLAAIVFGEAFAELRGEDPLGQTERGRLLAELAADPHSGLGERLLDQAIGACCEWEAARQEAAFKRGGFLGLVIGSLLDSKPELLPRLVRAAEKTESRTLSLDHLRTIDLSHLSGAELKWLSLNFTGTTDLSPLSGLSRLESLFLSYTRVTDLSPLTGLSKLETLGLMGCKVEDLSPLGQLSQLRSLWLTDTEVTDLSPLSELTRLTGLLLDRTRVEDVSALAGLSRLRMLSISSTAVTDISPLSGLTKLGTLSLRGTRVVDVAPLSGLTELRALFLDDTKVTDISVLLGMPKLRRLSLRRTQIPTDQLDELAKRRPELELVGVPEESAEAGVS